MITPSLVSRTSSAPQVVMARRASGRIDANSGTAPEAKPAPSSEPSASRPPCTRTRTLALADSIKVRVRFQERPLLGSGRALSGEPIYVVMAVAFDVRHAEQRRECRVLLQREPRLGCQILAGHEEARSGCSRIPEGAPRGVGDRLVEPFAALARHAHVTTRAGQRKRGIRRIAFIDQHRHRGGDGRNVGGQRQLARQRLFDIQRGGGKALEARIVAKRSDER